MSKDTEELEKEETKVEQVDVDINDLFALPGAESVITQSEEKKPNVFTPEKEVDTSFIDKPDEEEEPENKENEESEEKKKEETTFDQIADQTQEVEQEELEEESTKGRKKIDKNGLTEVFNKLIESEELFPFDDDKKIEDYSMQDYQDLILANIQERENRVRQSTPQEFYEALPRELQYAAKYVADGGTDMKGLFRALAQSEETAALTTDTEQGQKAIVREYLTATRFGDAAEIEEEIDAWNDRGELEAKASKFKPKLDKMQESIVQQKVAHQEELQRKQSAAAQKYMEDIYNTLNTGELADVKLDKKTQSMLYSGLVNPGYPSISGKSTNLLGHLLEKYQYVEPRHDLIAEALWLLADPEGYRTKIKEQGSNETTQQTVRTLKTEQQRKTTSAPIVEEEKKTTKRISRNSNFFKRTN